MGNEYTFRVRGPISPDIRAALQPLRPVTHGPETPDLAYRELHPEVRERGDHGSAVGKVDHEERAPQC